MSINKFKDIIESLGNQLVFIMQNNNKLLAENLRLWEENIKLKEDKIK
jgi:hypothetical protein